MCPIRIMAFNANDKFEPVLRVQVKEILEHTFQGVIDHNNKLTISITGISSIFFRNTLLNWAYLDPFERPLSFKHSKNERDELKISLSPVRVGMYLPKI